MQRKKFTIAGAEFSAPEPLGSAAYARIKEEAYGPLKNLGLTDAEINNPQHYMKGLARLLQEAPFQGTLAVLKGILRPESGTPVEDAFESDTKGEVGNVILFFSENLKAQLPKASAAPSSLPRSKKATPKRPR